MPPCRKECFRLCTRTALFQSQSEATTGNIFAIFVVQSNLSNTFYIFSQYYYVFDLTHPLILQIIEYDHWVTMVHVFGLCNLYTTNPITIRIIHKEISKLTLT